MRTYITLFCLFVMGFSEAQKQPYQDASLPVKDRVENLLSLMTLDEKIGQLVQVNAKFDLSTGPQAKRKSEEIEMGLAEARIGALINMVSAERSYQMQKLVQEKTRLKIPILIGYDVIHGHQTMFPVPLGLSASWDIEAMKLSAKVAAREAASQGIHWTFSPMIDISRDARWGRIMESGGEDPYLTSQLAAALVKGYQGDLSDPATIAACAKHFAGYGFAEAGRDYNTTEISNNTLHNVVLPPFKAAVDAGVATIMNSYNALNGQPTTANSYLQRTVLKGEWGFEGFVVSDWNSISEMVVHGYARNNKHAAEIAIKAGCDMDMMAFAYNDHLKGLVEEGTVNDMLLDDAVRRVLTVKFQLGLFENPYAYSDVKREKKELGSIENMEASKEVAMKTFVLLKNEKELLPINEEVKGIALIGPLAANKDVHLGNWRANAISNSAISIKEGLEAILHPSVSLEYAQGCKLSSGKRSFSDIVDINESDTTGFSEAIALAKKSELVILALGEDCFQSGEGRSQVSISLPDIQVRLLEEITKVNTNVIVVLSNGRPLDLTRINELAPTILVAWQAGSQAGIAIAEVLMGKYNPSGKLPTSFPRSVGQLPLYYNSKSTGRPTGARDHVLWSRYIDSPNDALFPFGYGLSYTSFEYNDLNMSDTVMERGGSIQVSVQLKNTGKYDGEEVVQLYIRDHFSSIIRPVKELKNFQKVLLKSGEKKTINFTLTENDLMFFNLEEKWVAEPGTFTVMVGGNSSDMLKDEFELTKR